VALPRCVVGEEVLPQRGLLCLAVSPELSPGLPQWTETVFVGDGVLDNERFGPLGIRDREPESYRAAVVLHDEGVPGQPESLGEIAEHRGQVVEGVRELGVPGCITVPEPGVVRCDQAERVGEPIQQWLPHAGRGGESVQEQDRGRILRSGLAIEDRQAVDVDGAVRRAMEFAGGLGIHSDVSAGVLDGQWAGTQSPCGSVVWPTSIR
jgi:hypothetical protein